MRAIRRCWTGWIKRRPWICAGKLRRKRLACSAINIEHVDYTSPEYIIYPVAGVTPGSLANSRNTDSHFVYIGADQSFTPNLNGSIRAGGEYLDYYNDDQHGNLPLRRCERDISIHAPKHGATRGQTYPQFDGRCRAHRRASPVLDEESTVVYLSVSHRVTSRFTAAALGQAQYSQFNGGWSL
jgi:hypothetical protein